MTTVHGHRSGYDRDKTSRGAGVSETPHNDTLALIAIIPREFRDSWYVRGTPYPKNTSEERARHLHYQIPELHQ